MEEFDFPRVSLSNGYYPRHGFGFGFVWRSLPALLLQNEKKKKKKPGLFKKKKKIQYTLYIKRGLRLLFGVL